MSFLTILLTIVSVFAGISLKSKRSRWRPRTTMAPCLQRQKTSTVQTPTTTRSTPKSTTRPASRGSPRHLAHSTAEILTHPSALLSICPAHHQTRRILMQKTAADFFPFGNNHLFIVSIYLFLLYAMV